ncbi:MAG: protein translocase subunit SecD, partial [Planctomycetota bacterium]|nr:protein translocase subunit SecD [Planctomycetota bacterium]
MKFAVVALLVVFCLWSLWSRGLRQGIDLRGGHSLIFEIRTHHAEIKRLQADQAELEKALQAATDKQEKKQLQDHILRIKADLRRYEQDSVEVSDLARRMIATLKNRVDPQGLRSLEWRPLGNRIEVRMPAGSQESQDAKNAYQLALERLEAGNVRQSQIRRVIQATGQQRSDEIAKLAADDSSAQRLAVLAAASDAMNQARRDVRQAEEKLNAAQLAGKKTESLQQTLEKAQAKLDDLTVDYEKHLRAVRDGNVSAQRLQRILENYVSRQEADAIDNRKEVARRMELFTSAIEKLRSRYSARRGDIDQVVAAYKDWARTRQELDDPADLERLIAKAGVLEYRIAPYSPESDAPDFKLTASERDRYVKNLLEEGPEGLRRRNERLLWFPIHGEREGYGSLVTADYAGKQYVLLYNQPGFTMLRETGLGGWSLARAQPTRDERMRPAVGFDFDEAGAKRFHNLTTAHKGHVLAVLLDDEVYSAPVIRTAISKRGTITGTFTPEEVNELVRILDAGSLPAKLNPKPVAVNTFGPAIGAVNKELGIRAAVWGLIAVAVFMLIYYQKAGLIADVALLLNMIFVLGTMSLLNAVFTLPGIAGLILTIGMAVDANVLIFERLREEQAKGISIRMALKNAYERAFSAIVDANITTMLVCLILGWVGTEEVRGFAITLGLGVAFSMFTSLVVTRWIFQLLLEMRLLKKSVFMLKLVGIPKINWMSKRHFFWGLTIIFMAMGIGSLAVQGRDIWGIEFSSGAQAIIPLEDDTLLEGKLPDDKAVREDFIA